MLIYRRTSLFESSAQTLVNTVNCVGVMGKGIAREFKKREPAMFEAYKRICGKKLLQPGKLWLWRGSDHWTLNFPTKIHWRYPSKIEWIESGLQKFVATYSAQGIREISFPQLGCGNGGLDWSDVKPLMERYLSPLPISVFVHDFTVNIGLPEHLEAITETLRKETPRAEPSFDAFVSSLKRATELSSGKLEDLEQRHPFAAHMEDANLKIEMEHECCTFEPEALRGVWVGLQKGLVTKEKAGWAVGCGSEQLLTLMSLLPQIRPIEIQREKTNTPELAVEFRPEERQIVAA